MQPLYRALTTDFHQPKLSGYGASTLHRWEATLRATRPRIIYKRGDNPHEILLTDSSAITRIVAAVICDRGEFLRAGAIEACRCILASGE